MLHLTGVKIQLGLKPLRCNLTYSVDSENFKIYQFYFIRFSFDTSHGF